MCEPRFGLCLLYRTKSVFDLMFTELTFKHCNGQIAILCCFSENLHMQVVLHSWHLTDTNMNRQGRKIWVEQNVWAVKLIICVSGCLDLGRVSNKEARWVNGSLCWGSPCSIVCACFPPKKLPQDPGPGCHGDHKRQHEHEASINTHTCIGKRADRMIGLNCLNPKGPEIQIQIFYGS